jgi:AcrR family transcriptional regulator
MDGTSATSDPGSAEGPAEGSARRAELLERTYRYVIEHGRAELSLRPLAQAVGSSPRVLLYLFGSKEGLIRALLAQARTDELAFLDRLGADSDLRGDTSGDTGARLADLAARTWAWLADDAHRGMLTLWADGYARSLTEPDGPWAGFAAATVSDWLALLAAAQPLGQRNTAAGEAERTLVLAVLRGALLDLLATGDADRTTAAVRRQLATLT